MNSIILCNTGSDSLSKISLYDDSIKRANFELSEIPVGPHGIVEYNEWLITANNYSDSISFFLKENMKEHKNFKIGVKPSDLIISKDKLYTLCGESNSLVVYDLIEERTNYEIKTDSWPYSICNLSSKGLIFISNLESNNIIVIDEEEKSIIKRINTPEYPTKIAISNDNRFLYVCESYLGDDRQGFLEIFSATRFNSIRRIKVGASPINLCEDNDKIYVGNFTEGTISIIDKNSFMVKNTIFTGGMPKGILKHNGLLYISDYLKSRLYVLENESIKKIIAIESEPNAMIII